MRNTAIIILAAGKGTRMKSQTAKVLHEISGRPMIRFVVDTAVQIAGKDVIIVVGTQAELVKSVVSAHNEVRFVYQEKQLGTGHAVLCALPHLNEPIENAVILCGDVPLIKPDTLMMLINAHVAEGNAITVLATHMDNPFGYGRLVNDSFGNVCRIVEEADATIEEKAINQINTGIYCVRRKILGNLLLMIKTENVQNEMYLTDIVGLAVAAGERVGIVSCPDSREIIGINTQKDLEQVETILSEKP